MRKDDLWCKTTMELCLCWPLYRNSEYQEKQCAEKLRAGKS